MTRALEQDMELTSTPLREEAPTVPVPRAALDHPLPRDDSEDLRLFIELCARAATRTGWQAVNGGVGRVERGCLIATYGALGELWGISKDAARRRIQRMARVGLVGLHDTVCGRYEDTDDRPKPAKGKVVALLGLADDSLIDFASDPEAE